MTRKLVSMATAWLIAAAFPGPLPAEEGKTGKPLLKGILSKDNVYSCGTDDHGSFMTWSPLKVADQHRATVYGTRHSPISCWSIDYDRFGPPHLSQSLAVHPRRLITWIVTAGATYKRANGFKALIRAQLKSASWMDSWHVDLLRICER